MNPMEQEYDDTVCAQCGTDLPEKCEADSWPWFGFCYAMCAFRFYMERAKFEDDELHKTQRTQFQRAIFELIFKGAPYEYRAMPAFNVLTFITNSTDTPDSYISEDLKNSKREFDAITSAGWRWVRNEGDHAIFERGGPRKGENNANTN